MLTWSKIDHRDTEHNDQTADLPGGRWAEIGPDHPTGWTWTILEYPGVEVADGRAVSEAQAKRDVEAFTATA